MKKENKEKKLTLKQENFCVNYVQYMNATKAYRLAYDCENMLPSTAYNKASLLLKKGEIRARISELKNDIEEALEINKITILKRFLDVADKCSQPTQKYKFVKGELTAEKDDSGNLVLEFDSNGANNALDKVMKAMGYYKQLEGSVDKEEQDFTKLSNEELQNYILLQTKLKSK